jgi:Ca2+-binding EF-hand superfamily protein
MQPREVIEKDQTMSNRSVKLVVLAGLAVAPTLAFAADGPEGPGGRAHMPRGAEMRGGMMGPEILNLAFSALDTDKDGKISKAEFEANQPQRLKAADANKDGTVTEKEFENFVVKQAKERAGQMFARLDTNKDGKIDDADAKQIADTRFDRVDANHDGSITRDEFRPRGMMGQRDRGPRDRGPNNSEPPSE